MMTTTFNSKQFIKEIQSRPCLWNVTLKEYTDKVARQKAWHEIGQNMYKDWANLEDKDQCNKIRDIQKKWKGLRDYFTRERNKNFVVKNGTRKKRKAPYLDMLSFLSVKKKTLHVPQNNQSTETMAFTEIESHQSTFAPTQEKQIIMPSTQDTMTKQPEMMMNPQDDPDRNFLLSLLPDMKLMTSNQNFDFRFEVMTLIKNIKYNQPTTDFYYNTPGPSSYDQQLPNYRSTIEAEIDIISNESIASSSEDIKDIFEESPNNSPSK